MHGRWDGEGSSWIEVKDVQLPTLMGTLLISAAPSRREGAEPGVQCQGLPALLWGSNRVRSTEANMVLVHPHVPGTLATHPSRG